MLHLGFSSFFLFSIQNLDEMFSSIHNFQRAISSAYRLRFRQFLHHWIRLDKLCTIMGMQPLLEIVTLRVQRLISLFLGFIAHKISEIDSPAYDACFECYVHHCSCGEGGYHFGRFQPDWQKVIFWSFFKWCGARGTWRHEVGRKAWNIGATHTQLTYKYS